MSDDLAARVLAAIEAKEATARAATRGPWRVDETGFGVKQRMLPGELSGYAETVVLGAVQGNYHTEPEDAVFIADNDPVDVLRRCAKDREIVAEHTPWTEASEGTVCEVCMFGWPGRLRGKPDDRFCEARDVRDVGECDGSVTAGPRAAGELGHPPFVAGDDFGRHSDTAMN